jgi:hypothetical protein
MLCAPPHTGTDACWRFDSAALTHKKVDGSLFTVADGPNPGSGVDEKHKANFTIFNNFAPGGTPLNVLAGDVACVYVQVTFHSAANPDGACAARVCAAGCGCVAASSSSPSLTSANVVAAPTDDARCPVE